MHHLATEHWILALKILLEESVKKLICLRIKEVEMVHAIFLRTYFGLIVGESQCMGWHINLWDDIDTILLGKFLKVDEFLFGVRAVARCQSGISVALQSECSLGLVPIAIEELTETIVVEMNLQGVHLIVSHGLDERTQIVHRNELTTAVHHKSTQTILRRVYNIALWQCATVGFVLLCHLQHSTCAPLQSFDRSSTDCSNVADADAVAFLTECFVGLEYKYNVALRRLAVLQCELSPHQTAIVGSKHLTYFGSNLATLYDILARNGHLTLGTMPFLQFGNYKRFRIHSGPCQSRCRAET